MGSNPTYDPSVLSRPITEERYEALFGEEAGSPRFNRAISGQYPTGSTFKPVTALAGLAEGLRTPDTPIVDDACVQIGEQKRCNAREHGLRDDRAAARAAGLLRRLLLHAGTRPQPAGGPAAAALGAAPGLRPPDGHRPAQRVRGHRARPRVARRAQPPGSRVPARGGRAVRDRRRHEPAVDRGRQRQPLGRPGRRAGHAAADGGRLRRRSPTAAASCARTWARSSRTPTGASSRRSTRRPRGA